MKLSDILKDSDYKLTQFSEKSITNLENLIVEKEVRGKIEPYVQCLVRKKDIKLTPEEVVRQLYINMLTEKYGYDIANMQLEYPVQMGRDSSKKADIVIFEKERPTQVYIVVELKQPNETTGRKQMESYCKSLGASIGIISNGHTIEEFYINKQNPKSKTNSLEKLSYLPNANQTLSDVLNVRYTLKNLILNDELKHNTLKKIILGFEDVVLANSGVDSFEEIFKLIFTKLFDEFQSGTDADIIATLLNHQNTTIENIDDSEFRQLEFRNIGTEQEVLKRLENLFKKAQNKWKGIFEENSTFKLTPSELKLCISYLQDVKLFNSNLEVIDDAFEYLVNKEQKGDKGQYFTPRYVIDMCVKMLNPKKDETMIDPAAGSCGFPMHTIFHVWNQINPNKPNLLTTQSRYQDEKDYVINKVFAIDFDLKSVRVARALNLIAGDGHTNVLRLNTLDYRRWDEIQSNIEWQKIYNDGFFRLCDLKNKNDYSNFNFDIVMANPPFAGDISDETILALYPNLGKNAKGKYQNKVGRDVLFIERNLDFLKPGGRMAIVLPQGRFNNSSDKYIREYIAERCRILAVVGLHGNTFKPHTGTKTSVLFLQKWDDNLCPKKDDYPIFFATMQESGKDNSGEKIYVKDENGMPKLDNHGHLIVKHDLFNHDGLTQDGIAEAFAEFAKKEQLSFF